MRIIFWLTAILVLGAIAAALGQHYRYLKIRRDIVADRQQPFHSSSAFHVATVFTLAPGQELLAGTKGLVDASEAAGGRVVYAGKIVLNAIQSRQTPHEEWEAWILAEYPSREAYDAAASSPELQKARTSVDASYALGMERSPLQNLMIPIGLLGIRVADVVSRRPSVYPFERGATEGASPEMLERRDRVVKALGQERAYGKDALVVLNFMKNGTPAEQKANAGYGRAMLGLMAKMGNGPMHMGRAVTLEGDADFDSVAIVYYPGVDYFAEMVQSSFFGTASQGKQLGDTLSSPSVPLLPHL
jgi:hypothetical protein